MNPQDNPTAASLVRVLRKIDGAISAVEKLTIGLAMVVMVLAIVGQMAVRAISDTGLEGASELSVFLMVYVGFLGASLAASARKHIVIDIIPKALKNKPRAAAAVVAFGFALTAIVVSYFVWAAWLYYQSSGVQSAEIMGLGIAKQWNVVIMPLALALIGGRFLLVALEETLIAAGLLGLEWERGSDEIAELIEHEQKLDSRGGATS